MNVLMQTMSLLDQRMTRNERHMADMRALVGRLADARLDEVSSHFGHDAFLKEGALLRPVFERLLEESP